MDEGLTRFHGIDVKQLPTAIQHDYFQCYADFYESNLADARGIASKYADHPVTRWRKLFGEVTSQLDEIEGKGAGKKVDDKPAEKDQAGGVHGAVVRVQGGEQDDCPLMEEPATDHQLLPMDPSFRSAAIRS